jgi:putative sterol carrier protein
MSDFSVAEMMESVPKYFNPEQAKGVSGVVQCIFTGREASNWVIRIENQTCEVERGTIENPDITIKTDAKVGAKLFTGQMDPMRALLFGKVKVSGNMALGMKLVKLFNQPF